MLGNIDEKVGLGVSCCNTTEHKQRYKLTCERVGPGPPFDGGGATLEAVPGADDGREREDLGVAAERCREASMTMLALSITGFSAMKDPENYVRVVAWRS